MRSTATLLLTTLLILLLVAATCDDQHPRKPKWWPDEPGPYGLKWPPPRPADWPEGDIWPPLSEVGKDPAFWTELWGEDIDPEKDPRLKKSGSLGNKRFRYNFEHIHDHEVNKKPGCGLHVLSMLSFERASTCTPFPEAKVREHCAEAFDEGEALQKCRRYCMRNEKRCRRGRLIEPPFYAYWRCATFNCSDHFTEPTPCPEPSYQTDCAAFYLCDCNEL